jgi:deoxyribodipyrimidine photo-lyase
VWWVRRDARLHDNPALNEAQTDGPAAAVFAWTPAIHFWSGRRRAHLARVLWSLREDMGGALGVRRGEAADAVLAVAREHDARTVWASQEYSPAGIRAQDAVAEALEADGRELRMIGSPYAVAPGRVTKPDGTAYRVFTPFSRAWREHSWRSPAAPGDPSALATVESDVDLDHQAAHGDAEDPLTEPWDFTEARALERLDRFLDERLATYTEDRDRPDRPATSGLSVALAFGQIHPRTILAASGKLKEASARKFESEVAWREFHADVLHHHPDALRASLNPVIPDDAWVTGSEADRVFLAWRDGQTGYPLVDAGMRELAATGTMHNRVRMVVASFLVKDLHVPWQRGADHFRRALLDYDHAQNQLNWQWVAGTGRDAAPYFRIFNPHTQATRYDPERRYIERWVAEVDTPAYPAPMVDHKHERERSLEDFQRGKRDAAPRG